MTHRIGSHSDDWGGDSDLPCDCETRPPNTPTDNAWLDEILARFAIQILGLSTGATALGVDNFNAKQAILTHIDTAIANAVTQELQELEYAREAEHGGDLFISQYVTKRITQMYDKPNPGETPNE